MRKIILLAFTLSSLQAVPITWRFAGTATGPSELNNSSIAGLAFELRIFLDTDFVAVNPMNLADVFFTGPHQAEVEIQNLGVLPVNNFNNVQYFKSGAVVTGVQFNQPAFSDIHFAAPISNDPFHLSEIGPIAPIAADNTLESGVFGPNGLQLFGTISTFSATLDSGGGPEPLADPSSTLLLLASAVGGLSFVRGRK